MDLALIIVSFIALCLGVFLVLTKQKLRELDRAVFISAKITNFIERIGKWQEESGVSPFDKNKPVGIDPHDVYSVLDDSRMRGKSSFEGEVKKYGDIDQL